MAALGRDGNVLGALSLVVADQMSDAVAAAADQSLTAAAALSALEHFADGCSVDRLRRILGLTSSGTVRLVDRLVAAGEVRRREGPDGRTTSIELTAAGRRAARRVTAARAAVLEDALGDLSPAERADLERLAARVLESVVRRKLAREAARVDALDLPAVRHAGVRARRGPVPGGQCGGRGWRRGASRGALAALRGANCLIEGRESAVARAPAARAAREFRAVRARFATPSPAARKGESYFAKPHARSPAPPRRVAKRARFASEHAHAPRAASRTRPPPLPSLDDAVRGAAERLAQAQRPIQEADRAALVGGRVLAQARRCGRCRAAPRAARWAARVAVQARGRDLVGEAAAGHQEHGTRRDLGHHRHAATATSSCPRRRAPSAS